MTYEIVYECCPWHTRVALFDENRKLVSIQYDDERRVYIAGAVILGRVRTVNKGLNAAFIDIGDVEDGFLPLHKLPKDLNGKLTEGQEIMVRIVRARGDGKGARLSARVIQSRPQEKVKVPHLVEKASSALTRALENAGINPITIWVVDERCRQKLMKIVPEAEILQLNHYEDEDILDTLDEQLEGLSENTFPINGGASMTIESTKALTSIDIDSGEFQACDHKKLARDINLQASKEIVRLCRLLNISGNIIVDFITMKPKALRREVREYMEDLFADLDIRQVEVMEMSPFGLLEINRERYGELVQLFIHEPIIIAGDIMLKLFREKMGGDEIKISTTSEVADILREYLTTASCLAYLGRKVEIEVG